MASFEIAQQQLLKTQGMYPYFDEKSKLKGSRVLCSDCFNDEGLTLDAFSIGIKSSKKCVNCGSSKGKKLTKELVRELCYRFFVRGTIERFDYGGCPLIQMNEHRINDSNIHVSPWLFDDVKLIEKLGEIGLFYYSPRFWMFGEIEPLKSLQNTNEIDNIVAKIVDIYPKHILNENHPFYRVRINPTIPHDAMQYDSPPENLCGNNRFDSHGSSILYGSPDLELCIHECRATVEDNLFVAKLVPVQQLKMLNLAAFIDEENVTEFTSVDLAIHFLFLAGKHSYPICGYIAQKIREQGFDGIIYPSYFSYTRTGHTPFDTISGTSIRRAPPLKDFVQSQSVPNVALFGRPIKEGKIVMHSINKVIINSIKYETTFGPAYNEALISKGNEAEFKEMKYKQYAELFREASKENI